MSTGQVGDHLRGCEVDRPAGEGRACVGAGRVFGRPPVSARLAAGPRPASHRPAPGRPPVSARLATGPRLAGYRPATPPVTFPRGRSAGLSAPTATVDECVSRRGT